MALTRPFAQNGDKLAIPETASDSSVSYNLGFTYAYALPPEEGGKFIDRAQFNQLMYDTTSQVIANTNAIATKANASATVNLNGNQTINNIKTFSVPPVSAANPTANNQVANKAYVDSVGNTAVKLTGTQSIAGAKTFTSNITAPNITAMQNSINALNGKIANLEQDETLELTVGNTASGASFQTLDEALAEAKKYFGNKRIVIRLLSDITINKVYIFTGSLYNNVGIASSGSNKTITVLDDGGFQFVECQFAIRNVNFATTSPGKTIISVLSASTGVIISCNFDGAGKAIVNRASLLMIEFCGFTNISATCIDNYRNGIVDCASATINANVASMVNQTRGGSVAVDVTTINSEFTTSKYNIAANTLTKQGIIFDND